MHEEEKQCREQLRKMPDVVSSADDEIEGSTCRSDIS
jgi:hypothetical protein